MLILWWWDQLTELAPTFASTFKRPKNYEIADSKYMFNYETLFELYFANNIILQFHR